MSCNTCSGCGSESSVPTTENVENLESEFCSNVDNIIEAWKRQPSQDFGSNDDLDELVNAMVHLVCCGSTHAFQVFSAVFDKYGVAQTLELSKKMVAHGFTGHFLLWAFEYCSHDVDTFAKALNARGDENGDLRKFLAEKWTSYKAFNPLEAQEFEIACPFMPSWLPPSA